MAETHEDGCLCEPCVIEWLGSPAQPAFVIATFASVEPAALFETAWFEDAAVKITHGVLKVYEYRSDESDRWIKLEFCPTCGTTVTYTAEWLRGIRGITAGTFDDPNWIKPAVHVWTRSALRWTVFPPEVELVETAPQLANSVV
jgi:hypothetical protein